MKKTAPEYGLEVSSTVDERYHVEKATKASCEYLKESYEMFVVVARCFHNMGRNGKQKAGRAGGRELLGSAP